MNSYATAFGILGTGIVLAALLWSRPRIHRYRQVRRFRRDLVHIDIVSRSWSWSLRHRAPYDETPAPLPEWRRMRRNQRRAGRDDEGNTLV